MIKKSSIVLIFVIVMMFGSSLEVRANEDVVGAEVTVEPEDKFTSYRTPEEDEILYDINAHTYSDEVDVDESKKMGINNDKNDETDVESSENKEQSSEDKKLNVDEKLVKDEVKYLDVVPQTGDTSNLLFWGILLVVALGATIGLGIYLIKKK